MYVVPLALFIGCIAPPDGADDKAQRGIHEEVSAKSLLRQVPVGQRISSLRRVTATVTYPDWGFEKILYRVRVETIRGYLIWAGSLDKLKQIGKLRIPYGNPEVSVTFSVPGKRKEQQRVSVTDGRIDVSYNGGVK
jgi:hypothetical protein